MREIIYKGQHCWLIKDVEKLIARKDEEIAELELRLTPLEGPREESKKDKRKEEKKVDEPKKSAPPNLGTPLTGDGIMGKSSK